jgi:hypothetical protein
MDTHVPVTFADYLRVPYVVRSRAVRDDDGRWACRVEHPELPGCSATAHTLAEAIDELDRRRVRMVLELLRGGRRPPLPRAPIPGSHPGEELERLGLAELVPLVDLDAGALNRPRGTTA